MVGILEKALATLGGRDHVPGVTDERVVFGQTAGFDSAWSAPYRNYTDGLMAWLDHVNAAGGVHGRRIEVQRLEDNFQADKAVENVRHFGEAGQVFGLVCIGGSDITRAVLPLLEQYKLPTVGTITGAEVVRGYSRYLFHTRAGYGAEVRKVLQHVHDGGMRRVAILHQDSTFGNGTADIVHAAAPEFQLEVVADIRHGFDRWEAEAIAQELEQARPQAVLMFTTARVVSDVARAYRALYGHGLPAPWVLSVTSATQLQELLGHDARRIAITQVMPHPANGGSRLAQSYRNLVNHSGRAANMSYEAMEGYVTGRIVTEALRRAGRHLTRDAFIQALESLGEYKVDDLHVRYTREAHTGPSFVEVAIVGRQLNTIATA